MGSAQAFAESPCRRLPIPGSSASTDQLDTGGDVESAPVAAMLEIGDLGDARHRRRETCIRIRTGTRSAVLSWHDRCYSTALSEPVRSESPVWAIVGDYGPAARGGTLCGLGVDGVVFWLRRGALRQGRGAHRRTAKRA
jgi:hypothetical protein